MTLSKVEAIAGLQASHRAFMSRFEALSPDELTAPLPVITGLVAAHHAFTRPLELTAAGGQASSTVTGTWRGRDLAAHIAAWDPLLCDDIEALLDGKAPAWLLWDDGKSLEINDQHVRERAEWPIERLHAELKAGRAAVIDAVSRLSASQFATSHRVRAQYRGPEEVDVSPAWLCEYFIEHDYAHTNDLPVPAHRPRPSVTGTKGSR